VLRHRVWIIGAVVGVAGFGLHVLALSSGSLSLVQPVLVTGLLFALPLSSILEHRGIGLVELSAAAVVVGGLIVFQLTARAAPGRATVDLGVLAWCVGVSLAGAGVSIAVAIGHAHYRASWLGFCAGVAYGLVAALLKSSVGLFAVDHLAVFTSWPFYAFVVLVGGAIAVNQLAFNAGPLASSLPLVTIVDPVVSVAIGAVAFGETTASRPLLAVGQIVGFVLMSIGVVVLARRGSGYD
jgi:drug/metabolite transporter (DMT)-like permease